MSNLKPTSIKRSKLREFLTNLCIVLCVWCLSNYNNCHAQVLVTGDIPYANMLQNADGTLNIWSMDKIRQHKIMTINPGGTTIKEKDVRSRGGMQGYQSLMKNETKNFAGELDLKTAVVPTKIAILVDDIATLIVKEIERNDGIEGAIFEDTFRVDGTALWNDRSYKEFSTMLPIGRKYEVLLEYRNNAHLTPKYDGEVDIDGVSIYVSLLPVGDLDIIHPATGELEEGKEDGANADAPDGGFVSVKRMIDDGRGGETDATPITKLKIHKIEGVQNNWKTRLKFNAGERYKIYKHAARTQLVVSETSEFPATIDTTVYFQGEKKSETRAGEEITLQIGINGVWYDSDSVKCTIVQSEFQIQVKAFISYAWTQTEKEVPNLPDVVNPRAFGLRLSRHLFH
jgi:hypothetical protein